MSRRNKYNARSVVLYGIKFDSQVEANRYLVLHDLEERGEIRGLKVHPVYELVPGFVDRYGKKQRSTKYIADFEYIEDDTVIVEDVKGGKATQTALFRLKKKLFLKEYPGCDFRIV